MQQSSRIIQKPIETPDLNLYLFLLHRSKINTSSILCRSLSQELSFTRLQQESFRYASAFASVGVKKGDIVPICSEPSIEAIIIFFALNRLGAISTFLNNTASIQEINKYITDFSARVIVLSKSTMYRDDIDDLCTEMIIVADSEADPLPAKHAGTSLSGLIKESSGIAVALDTCGKNDYAHISYTSGSTGTPKAIMLTNENIIAEMISLRKATLMQFGPKACSLQVVPFNYPYGFIVSTLLPMFCGKTTALTPGLTLKNIGDYLQMYHPCYINGIPSFYQAMMKDPKVQKMDLSFIRYPVTGGDTLDSRTEQVLNQFFHEHGSKGVITNGCGNGEGCGSLLNPASVLHKYVSGSCGRPLPGLSVKLIDNETGKTVPVGEVGKFCFSGTNLMAGYYQDGHVSSDMFVTDENGMRWFYTDTYMHMDSKQWMYMDGRERRFFITFDEYGSPYKVYCDYVQKVLMENCPELRACAVVQKADDTRSFVPVCHLCFFENVDPSTYESIIGILKGRCQKVLPKCAIPVEYFVLKEMPLTKAGKVDYRALE